MKVTNLSKLDQFLTDTLELTAKEINELNCGIDDEKVKSILHIYKSKVMCEILDDPYKLD